MTYIDRDIKTIGKHVNNAKEKSKMTESENIITVSCPECENHFSFSRNVLDFDGESGVGKELFAEQIYLNSKRSSMPFVRVNCASLSDTLMESELFGHIKGAYTSADSAQKGRNKRLTAEFFHIVLWGDQNIREFGIHLIESDSYIRSRGAALFCKRYDIRWNDDCFRSPNGRDTKVAVKFGADNKLRIHTIINVCFAFTFVHCYYTISFLNERVHIINGLHFNFSVQFLYDIRS